MKKHEMDFSIFVVVTFLLIIGVLMVFSSSFYYALIRWHDKYHFFVRHMIYSLIGFVAMISASLINYNIYKKFAKQVLFIGIVGLVLVFIPGIGVKVNGSLRWIDAGFIRFMPSEVAKMTIIIFVAYLLDERLKYIDNALLGVTPPVVLMLTHCALIMLQPNLSTAIIIALLVVTMLFIAGVKIRHLSLLGLLGIIGVVILAYSSEYRKRRMIAFINPFDYLYNEGWQAVHSLYALGTGGLKGIGLGQSIQNKLYLPEPQNDFILSTIGEEFGFLGVMVVILLYLFLIYHGIKIAFEAPNRFGRYLATGLISMIIFPVIINIAVATSSFPVTGTPLPFISFGGTNLVITLFGMGILSNISQYTTKEIDNIIALEDVKKEMRQQRG